MRAEPEQLADVMGWSEHFFIEEHRGSYVDERPFTGPNTHPTRDAAILACFDLAQKEVSRL